MDGTRYVAVTIAGIEDLLPVADPEMRDTLSDPEMFLLPMVALLDSFSLILLPSGYETSRNEPFPVFNLHIPRKCSGVPDELLHPERSWKDRDAFKATVTKLASLFVENFENYADKAGSNVLQAGPVILDE